MKVTYDPYADAIYLVLSEKKIKSSQTFGTDVVIDYAENKQPVGMEILSVSKKVPKKAIGSLQFELTTEKPSALLSS